MNRSIRSKAIVLAAVLLGSVGLAQAAHARTDVIFSVGIPAPVYAAPRYGYYDQRAWREAEWRREQWRREHWRRWHERHDGYYGYYSRY